MPAHCAALNCTSRAKYVSNGGEDEKITFHRFPIDLTLRTKWAQAMGRANKSGDLYIPTNGNYLCSLHFKKEDFDRTGQTVRLRPNTIPSNFVFPSHLQVTKNPRKTSRSRQAAQPVELALQEQDPGPSVETLCAVVQQEDKYNAMEACDSDLFESKSEPFTSEEDPEDNIDFESEAKLKSTEHIVIKEEPVDCEENSKGFTNHKGNADFEKEVKPSISELLWIKEESQQLQEMLEGVTYPEVHSDALDGQNGVNETYPNADPLDEMVVDPTYVTENETTLPSTSKRAVVLQKKWKNIRDHYRKEGTRRKTEKSGSGASSVKKEYIQTMPQKSSDKVEEDTDVQTARSECRQNLPNIQAKKKKVSHEDSLNGALSANIYKQIQEPKEDADKCFLMSLLPYVKSVPDSVKLECRCEIMQVLKKYNTPSINPMQYAPYPNSHVNYQNY